MAFPHRVIAAGPVSLNIPELDTSGVGVDPPYLFALKKVLLINPDAIHATNTLAGSVIRLFISC